MNNITIANEVIHSKLDKLNITLYSPLSMTYALLLAYLGSKGKSLVIFEKLFGFEKTNKLKIVDEMLNIKKQLESSTKSICKICNGVFITSKYNFSDFYYKIAEKLDINIQLLDFSNPDTLKNINKWISDNTNHLISNLLSSEDINRTTNSIFVNTIYFKGKWRYKFKPNLTNTNGLFNKTKATMMRENSGEYYKYYDDISQEVIELPYLDGFCMGIVLPKQKQTNDEYHDLELNIEKYFDKLTKKKVHVKIPKFEKVITIKYKQYANSLGISELFKSINFQDLFLNNVEDTFINNIIQQVIIKVDEEGTEAAAATAIISHAKCKKIVNDVIEFIADHSFVYYIKHEDTKIIMFKGILQSL
jgi:serine protease inhibitor